MPANALVALSSPLSQSLPETPAVGSRFHLARSLPFALVHLAPLAAFFVDVRWQDWAVCAVLYLVRMFGITSGYHRYFAHRAFRTSRVMQFLLAFLGTSAAQKGVLWWAGHHRHHHVHSDDADDVHSPKRGFWWSHIAWILDEKNDATPSERIRDFARYPELRFLNRHWWLPPTALAAATLGIGGSSMLFVGFFLSTVLVWHATFLVNSLAHVWGSRRFATTDTSRNNLLIALLTLGEGWHNNHHHYCSTANQGFYWWEIDLSYYVIKAMEKLGLVWGVRRPHPEALARNRIDQGVVDVAVPGKRARTPVSPSLQLQDAE